MKFELIKKLESLSKEGVVEYAVELFRYAHKIPTINIVKTEEFYDNYYYFLDKHNTKEQLIKNIILVDDLIDYHEALKGGQATNVLKESTKAKVFDPNNPDMLKGKRGELKTAEFFTHFKSEVIDMSDVQEYRNIDTDFLINCIDGKSYKIETKSSPCPIDEGFLIVEIYNDITPEYKKKFGWIAKCKSDFIDVYSKSKKYNEEYIYFYNTNEMKSYIKEVGDYYKTAGIELPTKWCKYVTKNQAIPETHQVNGFTNTEFKDFLNRNTTAHCLKVDINRYIATGRFLEIFDSKTKEKIYSTKNI